MCALLRIYYYFEYSTPLPLHTCCTGTCLHEDSDVANLVSLKRRFHRVHCFEYYIPLPLLSYHCTATTAQAVCLHEDSDVTDLE